MPSQTILITGSSSGIGLATAKIFAACDVDLIMVANDAAALKAAADELRNSPGRATIKYYVSDFLSFRSVTAFANEVKRDHAKIDVLINNAGAVFQNFSLTEDGLERTIALNYFAPHLLTRLLMDLLKKSPAGRIINLSSGSHFNGALDFDSFTRYQPGTLPERLNSFLKANVPLKLCYLFMGQFLMKAYAQSKLAVVMNTISLAEQLKGTSITVNCLQPGLVRTDIAKHHLSISSKIFWQLSSYLAGISAAQAAQAVFFLATSTKLQETTGQYFEGTVITPPLPLAQNELLRQQLEQISEQVVFAYL